jgi:hypothetical protein
LSWGSARFVLRSLLIATIIFVVVSFFFSMVLGVLLFFRTPDGVALSRLNLQSLVLNLFVVLELVVPLRLNVGRFFLGLWSIYLACLIAALVGPKQRFDRALEAGFSSSVRSALTSSMFVIPLVACMLLVFVVALQSLQERMGVPTGVMEVSDPFRALLSLTYAPLVETTGFRLTPIGAFLVPYLLWRGRRKVAGSSWTERLRSGLEAFLYPEGAKGRLGLETVWGSGLRKGVTLAEWVVVAATAFGFGLAHYTSGAGWDAGKISTAAIAGFCFGVAYLVYGVHTAILLHWFFDYYFIVYAIAAEIFSGQIVLVSILIDLVTIALGLAGWVGVLGLVALILVRKVRPRPSPVAPIPPVTTLQPVPRERYCLFCGSRVRGDVVFCTECGRRQEPGG